MKEKSYLHGFEIKLNIQSYETTLIGRHILRICVRISNLNDFFWGLFSYLSLTFYSLVAAVSPKWVFSIFHLLSHAELMELQVWSGLQVMEPLPLTCWPLGQVTRTDCPTWNSCWEPSSLQPGGAEQDLAVRGRNDALICESSSLFK